MKKLVKETKEVEVCEDIICDICDKSCEINGNLNYATLSAKWGYGSDKDLTVHEAHICEGCYDEGIERLGIKPTISSYHLCS